MRQRATKNSRRMAGIIVRIRQWLSRRPGPSAVEDQAWADLRTALQRNDMVTALALAYQGHRRFPGNRKLARALADLELRSAWALLAQGNFAEALAKARNVIPRD